MSYLPNDLTLSTTLDNSQVQANDAALDTAISGNLTELNLSSATRIPNSMLASPNVEETLVLNAPAASFGITTGNKAILYLSGSGVYTISDVHLDANVTGGTTTSQIRLLSGATFGTLGVLVNNTPCPPGTTTQTVLTSLSSTITAPQLIIMDVTTAFTVAPTGGAIAISLRVTRSLQ
jgi:hypothetical protein